MPQIKVLEVTDKPDGGAEIIFETNDEFDQMYLKETGKKQLTEKGLGNYITKILTKAFENKDGYSFKKNI
jgi:hypothetical protein